VVEAQRIPSPDMASLPSIDAAAAPPHPGENLDCSSASNCEEPTIPLSSVAAPPRDLDDVISQVPKESAVRIQQNHTAGGAENAREPNVSTFRSTKREHGMFEFFSTYWVWIISVVIASGPAGYWATRSLTARGRGVQSWQGWAAPAFAIGLVVAIVLPGQAGLYLDALLFLSFLCVRGFLAGAWLRHARTRIQVCAAGAVEEVRGATEVKTAEEPPRAAEMKDGKGARRAAKIKIAKANVAKNALCAENKATEDARHVAEVKAAADTRGPAKGRPSRKRAAAQKSKPPRARAAGVKAAENASQPPP
jgi:hypothetical protein